MEFFPLKVSMEKSPMVSCKISEARHVVHNYNLSTQEVEGEKNHRFRPALQSKILPQNTKMSLVW